MKWLPNRNTVSIQSLAGLALRHSYEVVFGLLDPAVSRDLWTIELWII